MVEGVTFKPPEIRSDSAIPTLSDCTVHSPDRPPYVRDTDGSTREGPPRAARCAVIAAEKVVDWARGAPIWLDTLYSAPTSSNSSDPVRREVADTRPDEWRLSDPMASCASAVRPSACSGKAGHQALTISDWNTSSSARALNGWVRRNEVSDVESAGGGGGSDACIADSENEGAGLFRSRRTISRSAVPHVRAVLHTDGPREVPLAERCKTEPVSSTRGRSAVRSASRSVEEWGGRTIVLSPRYTRELSTLRTAVPVRERHCNPDPPSVSCAFICVVGTAGPNRGDKLTSEPVRDAV